MISALKTLMIAITIGFVLLLVVTSSRRDPAAELANRKAKCTMAVMSDMGTGPKSYTDKQAYEARVAADCEGLEFRK